MCTYTGTHMHMLPFGVSIDFSQHFRATSFIMTRHLHTYISLHLAFIHPPISFSPLLLASALPQSLPLCFHGTYILLSSLAPPLPLNLLLSQPSPWSPSLRLHEELHTTDWGQCLELSEDSMTSHLSFCKGRSPANKPSCNDLLQGNTAYKYGNSLAWRIVLYSIHMSMYVSM